MSIPLVEARGWWRNAVRAWLRLRVISERRRVGVLRLEQVEGIPVVVLPDVLNPAVFRSSDLLAAAVRDHRPACSQPRVLDLGCGSGVQGIAAARRGWSVVASDINPEAVRCARLNALLNQVDALVEARQGDLLEPVAGEMFDLILLNPPFFRGQPKGLRDQAWRTIDFPERLASELGDHLAPGGVMLMVLSTDGDPQAYLQLLADRGFSVSIDRQRDLGNEIMTVWRVEWPS